jgi:hypothetical protein
MLAGIKRGKKKQKLGSDPVETAAGARTAVPPPPRKASAAASFLPLENNIQAAAALKALLQQPGGGSLATASNEQPSGCTSRSPEVLTTMARMPTTKREEDMTVQELAAFERNSGRGDDAHGSEARAVMRTFKHRKLKEKDVDAVHSDDEDNLVERHTAALQSDSAAGGGSQSTKKQMKKIRNRYESRQWAVHDRQQAHVQKSWWWMGSSRFGADSLVSLSPQVSLTLAPSTKSWHEDSAAYPHLYLVPVEACRSWAASDEAAWAHVQDYQRALRRMAAVQGKGVIFCEVVLPSTGGASTFYQARMQALIVPRQLEQEAALVFKMALNELALEHGTHQRPKPLTKDLIYQVPSHFSYIYVDFGTTMVRQGYILVLEERPEDVTVDWPANILGGRLGMDPLRMRRPSSKDNIAERAQAFSEVWKDYDWTNESSGET